MIKNHGFPYSVYTQLYNACVCSVSMYGSEVFGYHEYDSLYKLHLRALRAFFGLPKNVTSAGLLSEVDWLLPKFQSQLKMIHFFGRILRTEENRLLSKIYKWDFQINSSGLVQTWTSEVKDILNKFGMANIFERQQIFPVQSKISELKMAMIQNQVDDLKIQCAIKPKLRTFITYKNFSTLPPNVGKPLSFVERRLLSKIRLGILPLRLETGQFERPILPENMRVCYCGSGKIENEYYVLFECPMYNELRQNWLQNLYCLPNFTDLPAQQKLGIALNDAQNVKSTAKYLVRVMDLRAQLYQ